MPTVTGLDNFSVMPGTQGAPALPSPDVRNHGPEQTQQLGQALQGAGQAGANIALDMQRDANQLRVDDAINQAKEQANRLMFDPQQGFTQLKGYDALHRPDGLSLQQEYGTKLSDSLKTIGQGLSNQSQREAFQRGASAISSSFDQDVIRHLASEYDNYDLSTRKGIISNSIDTVGLKPYDAVSVADAVDAIRRNAFALSQRQGLSAEENEANTRQFVTQAHVAAISSMLEGHDPAGAAAYFNAHKQDMSAEGVLKAGTVIQTELDTQAGIAGAEQVFNGLGRGQPPADVDRAFNVAVGSESNYRQLDKSGAPLTSPKGAVGVAQVMEGTGPEAAKLAGVAWDRDKWLHDASYNLSLGRAYFQKQVVTFGGDLDKAWAAYNMGPGPGDAKHPGVQGLVDQYHDQWLAHAPAETQAYVAKNREAYAGGGGGKRASLSDMLDQVDSDPSLALNPERRKIAEEHVRTRYAAAKQDEATADRDATDAAYKWLDTNGGNITAMPPSIRNALPGDKLESMQRYAALAQQLHDGTLKPDTNLRADLHTLAEDTATSGRGAFMRMDLHQYAARLGPTYYKELTDLQQKMKQGDFGITKLTGETVNGLKVQLAAAGFDTTNPTGNDAVKLNNFYTRVREQIQAASTAAKRPLTTDEATKLANGLLAKQAAGGWFGTTQRNYEMQHPLPNSTMIPPAAYNAARQSLQNRRPGAKLNDAQVMAEYGRLFLR